jgi:hypothetical protein
VFTRRRACAADGQTSPEPFRATPTAAATVLDGRVRTSFSIGLCTASPPIRGGWNSGTVVPRKTERHSLSSDGVGAVCGKTARGATLQGHSIWTIFWTIQLGKRCNRAEIHRMPVLSLNSKCRHEWTGADPCQSLGKLRSAD